MERKLEDADYQKLMDFIFEAQDHGTHYHGQTYEDGMLAVIDLMDGNVTIDEITE